MTRMITRLAAAVLLATAVSGGTIAATTKSSPIAQAAQTIKLNEKQALAKFKQKYAKAKISEISLEKHHNRYQYEISGFDSQKRNIQLRSMHRLANYPLPKLKNLMLTTMRRQSSLIRSSVVKKPIN